jgi:hypothetical protein
MLAQINGYKIFGVTVLGLVVVIIAMYIPDFRRYLRIKRM